MQKPTITFLGQAGFVFTSSRGTTLGVDLYLSDCVEHSPDGFKRLSPKLIDPAKADLDFIVATHEHLDHYDVDAMPHIIANGKTVLVASQGCRELARDIPDERKHFLSVGDCFLARDIFLRAVPCDHGDDAPSAIGLVVEVDGARAYIAGDTHFRPDYADHIAGFGPFDIVIAPINGMFGNLDERQAARICARHAPRLAIPCHYWMFAEHHGDPGVFADELARLAPGQGALLMCPGESACLEAA